MNLFVFAAKDGTSYVFKIPGEQLIDTGDGWAVVTIGNTEIAKVSLEFFECSPTPESRPQRMPGFERQTGWGSSGPPKKGD